MKKIFFSLIGFLLSLEISFADAWILWDFKKWTDYKGTTEQAIRRWDIHTDDIPNIMRGMIDFLMQIAGTIAIIFIIVWAYHFLTGTASMDKTKWIKTIKMALWGFALSALSWFIIKLIIDNFL